MHRRLASLALVLLTAGLGVWTATRFARGLVAPGVLGVAGVACLIGWGARAGRERRRTEPADLEAGGPRPASAPPDGHLRFTLVVEGLAADRVAAAWSELCRPGRPAPEELRRLFRTFTVVEGPRFRFRRGDPAATAELLRAVLEGAAGAPVRTRLEPAAERTPPWS